MSKDDGIFPVYDWPQFIGANDGIFPLGIGKSAGPTLPSLVLAPTYLTFYATQTRNNPATQTIQVTNGSIGTLDAIEVSKDADWLHVWLGGTGNDQTIFNSVEIADLAIGSHTATVSVSCDNASNSPQVYFVTVVIDTHADATQLDKSIIIWVATTGDDVTGTGSQQNPYKTIERALQDFSTGNQIRLLNGTYTPADTISLDSLEGSIFAETPGGVIIQPKKTTQHGAAIAIINSTRFTIRGIHVRQSTETQTVSAVNNVGIYANNAQNLTIDTCVVSDFTCADECTGIWVSGSGKIENCLIEDLAADNGDLHGIYAIGVHVIDNTVRRLIYRGNGTVSGIITINTPT